jgi:protein O-mannosyl-transferase
MNSKQEQLILDETPASAPNRSMLLLIALLLATLAAYAATARFGFAYDDFLQIVYNRQIESVHSVPGYFTHQVWAQATDRPANLYRPLFLSWLLINRVLFGLNPVGWHLATLLMHVFATLLVYRVGGRLLHDSTALFSAAVFGLHPVHVEGVAWVSGVTEPMTAVFFLSAFLAYLNWRESGKTSWMLGSLLGFSAAMLVKETAVMLPAVILAYELGCGRSDSKGAQHPKPGAHAMALKLAPYALLLIAYLAVRMTVLHGFAHKISDVPPLVAVLTWPRMILFYLGIFLVPVGLGPFYDLQYVSGLSLTGFLMPVFIFIAIGSALWYWARRVRSGLPLFLGAWFLLTLAPALASALIMSHWESLHDRYMYLPSVALVLLAGDGLRQLFSRQMSRAQKLAYGTLAICLVLGFAILASNQTLFWANDLALFRRGVAVAPANALAKLNLAAELSRRHDYEPALELAREGVELDLHSIIGLDLTAQACYYMEDYDCVERYSVRALSLGPAQPQQLYYLGMARIKAGRYIAGLEVIRKGLSIWPGAAGYHYALGVGLSSSGDWASAKDEFRKELVLYPDDPAAKAALAEAEGHLPPRNLGVVSR